MGTVEESAKKQAEALRSEIRAIVREELKSALDEIANQMLEKIGVNAK